MKNYFIFVFFLLVLAFTTAQSQCPVRPPEVPVGTVTVSLDSEETPSGTLPNGYPEFEQLQMVWKVEGEGFGLKKLLFGVSGVDCEDRAFVTLDGVRLEITKELADQTMFEFSDVELSEEGHILSVSADAKCRGENLEENKKLTVNLLGFELLGLESGETISLFPDKPVVIGGTFTVHTIDPNGGTLWYTKAEDSPVGYLPIGAPGRETACFDAKANGDDIIVFGGHNVRTVLSDDQENLNNGQIIVADGLFVSPVQDLDSDASPDDYDCPLTPDASGAGFNSNTCFSFEYMVPFGETRRVCVVADLVDGDGGSLESGSFLTVSLLAGGDNYQNNARGRFSGREFATNSVSGNTLILVSNQITASKNLAVSDGSAEFPSASYGGVGVWSFVVTGPLTGYGKIQAIELQDEMDGGDSLADIFQNLRIFTEDGSAVGTIKPTLTDTWNTRYTFSATPNIPIGPLENKAFYVLADVKNGVDVTDINLIDTDGELRLTAIVATLEESGQNIGFSSAYINLQNLYIAPQGKLTLSPDAATPKAQRVAMGDEEIFLSVSAETDPAEDMYAERLVFTDKTVDLGGVQNLSLYDESGRKLAPPVPALTNVHSGYVTGGGVNYACLSYGNFDPKDDMFNGMSLTILSGPGEFQGGFVITDFDATGGQCELMATVDPPFTVVPSNNSQFVVGGQAVFQLYEPYLMKKSSSEKFFVRGYVSKSPDAVSGATHQFMLTDGSRALPGYQSRFTGASSRTEIIPSGFPVSGNVMTVYATDIVMLKSGNVSSTGVGGANSTVLQWTVTNTGFENAGVFPPSFTLSGSEPEGTNRTITGTQSAVMYDVNDLGTPLFERKAKTIVFQDGDGIDSGNEYVFEVNFNSDHACEDIPEGSTVNIWDASAGMYFPGPFVVKGIDTTLDNDCRIIVDLKVGDFDNGDVLEYFPAFSGPGKLAFIGVTEIMSDMPDAATSVNVKSTQGFSVGDSLYLHRAFSSAGVAVNITSGCVIIGIPTATKLYTTPCRTTGNTTVDADYREPFTQKTFSGPVISSIRDPLKVAAKSFREFVLMLDTTGLSTLDTLRVDILGEDQSWTDYLTPKIQMSTWERVLGITTTYKK